MLMFRRRFEPVPLAPHSSVLCLAARLGSEVEAFISLGHFAIGIDLNPGPDNPFVVSGDFHALQFADHSVDCVYTNSLDHAFDIEKITREVRRVLKPGGMFLLEAVAGHEEGYLVGPHDTTHWPTAAQFAATVARIGGFSIESSADLAERGSAQWFQFLLKSPAA
jgi:ubiquinone/menaquinone biosynthesis C-methylase UbiE